MPKTVTICVLLVAASLVIVYSYTEKLQRILNPFPTSYEPSPVPNYSPLHSASLEEPVGVSHSLSPSPTPSKEWNLPVLRLLDALKEVTRLAAGGQELLFTQEERELWKVQNPCRARVEMKPMYSRRTHVEDVLSNPDWDAVLEEYGKMHRTCLRVVGNLTNYFTARNTSTGCRFLVADIIPGAGLGNKMLVSISYLLYAILTQRVFLISGSIMLPFILCEPFEGSSWTLAEGTVPSPPENYTNLWQLPEQFYKEIDRSKLKEQAVSAAYAAAVTYDNGKIVDHWHPRSRFFCNTEQSFYHASTWLYVTGCLYTLPRLFAVNAFRPTLEALFPDRMVLTHLLRTAMLPADTVWDRSVRVYSAYLAHADRRVGIQVRYKDGLPHYKQMNDVFNERITKCGLDNSILPNVNRSIDTRVDDSHVAVPSAVNVVTIFIACLYTGLHDHLTRLYLRHPSTTAESVALVQITHEDRQEFGLEVDREALAEVIGLSFSDDLIVTPISTYGGMAQAYGALKPWFIEIRTNAQQSCTKGQSVDVCYQQGATTYDCPYDEDVHGKLVTNVVPYLQNCLKADFSPGIQLITG